MCLLAILHRVCSDAPLVVGANREEYFARGGEPPRRLDDLAAVAGIDPTHGGTWLGVNARGVLIAVTNRPGKTTIPDAPRSRGLLARELLGCASAGEAIARAVRALDGGPYAGCNFFCADAREAVVIHAGDWLRIRPLPPGIFVLSNRDVNDPTDHRASFAAAWLAQQKLTTSSAALAVLANLCASHEPADAPLCFRHEHRGSVSSSLIGLRASLANSVYLHAQGPADVTPYSDLSYLLHQLAQGRKE